ncbi:MAG: 7-carboxy-7-deazaguanine synthase QueE [Flavobacterium sp.]|uniref:7-carboxy-7-deazaguanine synthase QueE n=1 Tax=Flavobacterium sp. TaxID=239 RepID=UPI0026286ADC|nr:7-carboxy-7-deazaguanine synthase QueE [Flavobacterium sp.]MDD5150848.1 7-carboxy-7-deazaguanine synthase QueE [Flavobacterium sp.]
MMNKDYKTKVSEIFTSFQGEAKYSGIPSIWVRFFGCNLRCNGFGQIDPTDEKTYELPYETVDITGITKIEDLPVFEKGCDSSYSWSKKFRHLCNEYTIKELVDRIIEIGIDELGMKSDSFQHKKTNQSIMLCFTGGEPLLYQGVIVDIFNEMENRFVKRPAITTIETNAVKKLTNDMKLLLQNNFVHFACSPKLYTVSGEKNVVDIENILDYNKQASSLILKFVVDGSRRCWDELDYYVTQLINAGFTQDIYVMPAGATINQQSDISHIVIEAMNKGYYIATRNHCYVFGNKIGK